MADLRDEQGNPIQLTDQYGNPVQLTDEYGNPMHLSGVAYSTTAACTATTGPVALGGAGNLTTGAPLQSGAEEIYAAEGAQHQPQRPVETAGEIRRSTSSSSTSTSTSSSSGEEGQRQAGEGKVGRRKKKGLKEKIKEKLTGGKHRDARQPTDTVTTTATTGDHEDDKGVNRATDNTATTTGEHREHEKGVMEKIMEKLPGHHGH
ncbi:hypothetical protein Nepgr_004621 [Nepenthes gracilis]|uniref:Dehydrin n=1 Tax=Nepenthes gracilis TaxID=150966 RepID=A0AAD3S1W3_NEPGR|nr:hypothetical protein Nepgr_004621 [Nepenthes gracilis]